MAKDFCILCKAALDASTKPEHILLKALGGKKTSRRVLCSTCNAEMGAGPDNDLAESVRVVRNIGNFLAGDGRNAPPVHGFSSGGIPFDLLPEGKVRPRIGEQVKITKGADGETSVSIQAPTLQLFRQRLEDALKSLSIDANKKEAIRREFLEGAEIVSTPIPTLDFDLSFGAVESLRSVAKCCMALWSWHMGNMELLKPTYDEIRRYIRSGEVAKEGPNIINIKTAQLPSSAEEFSRVPHFVWVGSNETGEARGYFHFYGVIGWSVLLCSSGAPPDQRVALLSDPEDPKRWQIGEDAGRRLDYAWVAYLDTPFELNLIKKRMNEIRKIGYEKAFMTLVNDAYFSTLFEMGIDEDSPLGEFAARELSNAMAHKVVFGMNKIPYKRNLRR